MLQLCDFRPLAERSSLFFVLTTKPTNGIRCKFPFLHLGEYHNECVKLSPSSPAKFCRTGNRESGVMGECSAKFKGKWSNWSDRKCSRPCGGGVILFQRTCLYSPCVGEASKATEEKCNTHACLTHALIARKGTVQKMEGEKCIFPFLSRGMTYQAAGFTSSISLKREK